jgi:hypothetical protein
MTDTFSPEGTDTAATATAATATPAPINEHVSMAKTPFHFKTDKVRDAEGKVIGNGKKHPSVDIYLPVPKAERLAQFLTSPGFDKERDLVLTAVSAIIFGVARGQINDFREKSPDATVTPAVVNYDKLDFTAIANMPKSERGSFVPADEDVAAFLESYLAVMPAATNKPLDKIKNHCDIISTGFKKQRAQKDMLEFFKDALGIYVLNAPEEAVDEHSEVLEYFNNKLDRMLKVEERITMDDL